MKFNWNKQQTLIIAGIVAIGIVLAWLILGTSKSQPEGEGETHGSTAETASQNEAIPGAPQKGPHDGKLFTQDGYGVEVTIFETGVEPEFRVYTYQGGKPLDPAASQVTITLERLGRLPQEFTFVKEKDYLKGNASGSTLVEEPHSFRVNIAARHNNKAYRFGYEQIEARVTITDQQVKQNGIELLTAGPARIESALQLIGEIRFNQDRQVIVVPRIGNIDLHQRSRRAHAPQLAHQTDKSIAGLPHVLQRMVEQHLIGAAVVPRPGQALEIHQLIRLARCVAIDVAPAGLAFEAAAEVEFHHGNPLRGEVGGTAICC